jgi:hypothetical protein
MKILVNYKKLNVFQDEFFEVELKKLDAVFVEMPIAIAEYDYLYQHPVLYVGPDAQIATVMEAGELLKKIEGTKIFYLKRVEPNRVIEVPQEQADFGYRLPIDTPVEKLAIIQGQLGLLEDTEV